MLIYINCGSNVPKLTCSIMYARLVMSFSTELGLILQRLENFDLMPTNIINSQNHSK